MNRIDRMISFALIAVCLMIGATGVARAEEQVANPQYDAWAKHKPGTVVKYAQSTETMGQKHEGEITMTLVSITPEKATVETKVSMMSQGKLQEMPAQKMDFPAKVNKSEAKETGQPAANIQAEMKQGEEKVEVAGKTYECKWTEVTSAQNGMNIVAKTWLSDAVPGKLVKMEATTTGAMASSTKMTLASMETK